jgi:flagellar hook-basal body complex protein FliE
MRIDNLVNNQNIAPMSQPAANEPKNGASFGDALNKAIEQVNNLQTEADKMAVKVAAGDTDQIHQAIIAMEKASLALDLTIQVRNKAIEAYQELIRTQV